MEPAAFNSDINAVYSNIKRQKTLSKALLFNRDDSFHAMPQGDAEVFE
jgi:hypothetical protein